MEIIIYLVMINALLFIMMGIDKAKAKKNKYRIPEKVLFTAALMGGTIGGIMGMYVFRHKTMHRMFKYGFPAILIMQVALGIYIYIA